MSKELVLKTHSKLGASSAERWMNCPGSVELSEMMPDKEDTAWSLEGTNAHSLMEWVLKNPPANAFYYVGKRTPGLNSQVKHDWEVTQEMAEHIQDFVDKVRWQFSQLPGAVMHVEKKFHLSRIHPLLYGTADVAIFQPFGVCYVIDLKYGAGIAVDPIDNPQLLYYALGATEGEDFGKLVLVIAQPRIAGGEWQEWETTPEHLVQFSKTLKMKALATEKKNAPLQEGDWCRWCKAASVCPQLAKKAVLAAQTDFTEEGAKLPALTALTDEQIVRVIEFESQLVSWIKSVKQAAFLRLMTGEKIEGLKLVRGKNSRDWESDEAVVEKFGSKIFSEPKLMTPKQAESVIPKKDLSPFIITIAGGVQITHGSDKRAEYKIAADDFEKLSEPKLSLEDF